MAGRLFSRLRFLPLPSLAVFMAGAVGMTVELIGARILSPHVGTTIPVWAILIGCILGSLSLGYAWGGRLADRYDTGRSLAGILIGAAGLIFLIPVFQLSFLSRVDSLPLPLADRAAIATLLLFALPSFLLGSVSPLAAKRSLSKLETAGRTIGNLSAASALGSITGSFLTGLYLIEYLGNDAIFYGCAGILFLLSLAFSLSAWRAWRLAVIAIASLGMALAGLYRQTEARAGIIEYDSLYSHILIYPATWDKHPIRILQLGDELSSAMYEDNDDLVFPYTRFYRLAFHFNPSIRTSLLLGGAAYSYPKDYLRSHPNARMDVVEIDPAVTKAARQYFRLTDDPRLRTIQADARPFLNQSASRYDAVFGDAFRSQSLPFQLATRESAQRIYDRLQPGGVYLLNIISSFEGPKSGLLQAEYATLSNVFPQVYAFAAEKELPPQGRQNIIMVALKNKTRPSWTDESPELQGYLESRRQLSAPDPSLILRDDFAPVERYVAEQS